MMDQKLKVEPAELLMSEPKQNEHEMQFIMIWFCVFGQTFKNRLQPWNRDVDQQEDMN